MGKHSERDTIIIKNLSLVESVARKFSTSDQASGVLSINDMLQAGAEGLILAVDRIDWNVVNESEEPEKTLRSFLSKRIRGAIRREIDINRGDMRIPEYKLNEIRKSDGGDKKIVQMFFNSIFSSIDIEYENDEDNSIMQIEDKSEKYNIDIINKYLLGLMRTNLSEREYDVLRMSYGLDCDKMPAKEIADKLNIEGTANYVRVSQIKRDAIDTLIQTVDKSQVLDFL
jgi:RNA polymerase sigma factor (sigma-70 family)